MRHFMIGGILASLLLCILPFRNQAQTIYQLKKPKEKTEPLRNLRVISEEPDGKGNIVRVVQYDQGLMKVTQTTITPQRLPPAEVRNLNTDTLDKKRVRLVVDKSRHCLMVFYNRKRIRVYKATFGPRPLQNKMMEGDRCTPEGEFTITRINPNSKYNKFFEISYPGEGDWKRFKELKQSGVIPKTAKIGGNIGIHGIWPGGDDMIELGVGWTDGCVALKNEDLEDLSQLIGLGTTVYIAKEVPTNVVETVKN